MFVRSLWVLLLCSSCVMAQKEDRRRLNSTAFRRGEVVQANIADARWHVGDFYISPIIGLRQLGYDNNVFSTESNEVNDFSLAPEVGIQAFYKPGSRWIWENRVTYDYLYYVDLDNLRGSEYSGESRVYGLFKKAYVELGAKYREDRQRLNSEIDDRVNSQRLAFDGAYSYQHSARALLSFTAKISSLEYKDAEAQEFLNLERDETTFNVRYHYQASNTLWPFLELEQLNFDFKSPNNPRDNTSFTGAFVGLRTVSTRRLTLEGKVGITHLDFDPIPLVVAGEDGIPTPDPNQLVDLDDDIFSLELFLRYKLNRRFYVESSLLNAPIFSGQTFYNYFVSSKESVELGYETRRKFRIGPEIIFGRNDYQGSFSELETVLREDTFRGLNINATFPFRRIFEWRLSAGYLERDSNKVNDSDKGYQISSTIRYKRAR